MQGAVDVAQRCADDQHHVLPRVERRADPVANGAVLAHPRGREVALAVGIAVRLAPRERDLRRQSRRRIDLTTGESRRQAPVQHLSRRPPDLDEDARCRAQEPAVVARRRRVTWSRDDSTTRWSCRASCRCGRRGTSAATCRSRRPRRRDRPRPARARPGRAGRAETGGRVRLLPRLRACSPPAARS